MHASSNTLPLDHQINRDMIMLVCLSLRVFPWHCIITSHSRYMLNLGSSAHNSRQTSEHRCGTSSHYSQTSSRGLLMNFNHGSATLSRCGRVMDHISMILSPVRFVFLLWPYSPIFLCFTGRPNPLRSSDHCFYCQVFLL